MTDAAGERRRWTLDPKIDLVFSMLFGAEQNRRLLVAFLNDVLKPSTPIVFVEVLPTRPETTDIEGKMIFLDLRVRLASGEQIDVEMQTRKHAALRARVLMYWGRMYTGQLQRGDTYSGLKRCVVILITSFRELPGPGYHSVFQVRERTTGELLTDHLELHVLELPKLQDGGAGAGEPALSRWCRFLSAETDEQLRALAMQDTILNEAKDALEQMSADPDARERAERRLLELRLLEQDALLLREQGRQEGRQEQKLVTLRRLLTVKFGALPHGAEARLAHASAEDVDRWLDQVVSADSLDDVFD
jgi:predicted transposase/invertase (TIGR01784 family)